MNKIAERIKSDKAASQTVETIIIIALAVFAALALFTFVLKPTQNSADNLGQGIDKGVDAILNSKGQNIDKAIGSFGEGGSSMGSAGAK